MQWFMTDEKAVTTPLLQHFVFWLSLDKTNITKKDENGIFIENKYILCYDINGVDAICLIHISRKIVGFETFIKRCYWRVAKRS